MKYWNEKYRIGVEEIDTQHKKLFEIAGKIYELLVNEFYSDKYDKIIELVQELKDYTVYHFKYEEEYQQKIGYKKFFTHKVEHDDFIEKINEVDLTDIDEDHDQYLVDILEFVVKWIDEHILEKDKLIVAG